MSRPESRGARQLRILAVSSGGGHWEQMMLLREAFAGQDIFYATTIRGLIQRSGVANAVVIADCNRDQIVRSLICFFQAAGIVLSVRPDVVVSTGAAPGFFCLLFGRLVGAKTIWIDSVANVETLSMCGRLAGFVASLWLTQWPHLSRSEGPHYVGELL